MTEKMDEVNRKVVGVGVLLGEQKNCFYMKLTTV